MTHFLGIAREAVFSPGRVDDDAAILLAVADALRSNGNLVTTFSADEPHWPEPTSGTVVFTMAQGDSALGRLRDWERRGIRVVNCSEGILNCQRHRTVPLLTAARVSFPLSEIVVTRDVGELPAWSDGATWVKRGDVHATEGDDVVLAGSASAVRDALDRFSARGIPRAVLQHHIEGTVFKFYAVRGCFFHCVGGSDLPSSVSTRIDEIGRDAAQALGVEVYGGDCVYGVDGGLTLIDLNDWPSYARCRFSAATAIAAYVGTSKSDNT